MSGNYAIQLSEINKSIDFLEDSFIRPLKTVGQDMINEYSLLNQVLNSASIRDSITEQQNKLDNMSADLETIFTKARASIEESSNKMAEQQAIIEETV